MGGSGFLWMVGGAWYGSAIHHIWSSDLPFLPIVSCCVSPRNHIHERENHVDMQSKPRPRGAQKASLRELELNVPPEASWHREYRGSAYVYVGGLHFGLTEGDVLAVFAQVRRVQRSNPRWRWEVARPGRDATDRRGRERKRTRRLTELERDHVVHVRIKYGEVVDINLVRDKETGKSKVRVGGASMRLRLPWLEKEDEVWLEDRRTSTDRLDTTLDATGICIPRL